MTATEDKTSRSANVTPWIIAFTGWAAVFMQNVQVIHDGWCRSVGPFCKYDVYSQPVAAWSGGNNRPYRIDETCHEHSYTVKLEPSKWPRKLETDSLKFVASEPIVGRYDNGLELSDPALPKGSEAPEVGWFVKSKSKDLIKAVVFSRTGACESRHSIVGKFQVTEHNFFGW